MVGVGVLEELAEQVTAEIQKIDRDVLNVSFAGVVGELKKVEMPYAFRFLAIGVISDFILAFPMDLAEALGILEMSKLYVTRSVLGQEVPSPRSRRMTQ